MIILLSPQKEVVLILSHKLVFPPQKVKINLNFIVRKIKNKIMESRFIKNNSNLKLKLPSLSARNLVAYENVSD